MPARDDAPEGPATELNGSVAVESGQSPPTLAASGEEDAAIGQAGQRPGTQGSVQDSGGGGGGAASEHSLDETQSAADNEACNTPDAASAAAGLRGNAGTAGAAGAAGDGGDDRADGSDSDFDVEAEIEKELQMLPDEG
ncbi:hypothetical protein HK405_000772, partial [Cladochytrium tenue]